MSNLEKVTPGQRIHSLPAGDWNAFVDAARIVQGEQLNQAAEGELPEFSPVVVLVKNATGGHLPRYSVLGINGPVADPQLQPDQFRNQIVLVAFTRHAAAQDDHIAAVVAFQIAVAVVVNAASCPWGATT